VLVTPSSLPHQSKIFKHPIFAQPNRLIDDGQGAAGVITSIVVPSRQLEFAVKRF
jgi:hypothetical protein